MKKKNVLIVVSVVLIIILILFLMSKINDPNRGHICEFVYTTVEPTCEQSGMISGKCACGNSCDDVEISATGHTYINGVCSCGKKEVIELDTYKIIIDGRSEYIKNSIASTAKESNKIVIETQKLIDADIEVYINNVKVEKNNENNESIFFEFVMPAQDVLIEIRVITIEYYTIIFNSNDGVLISGDEQQIVSSLDDIIYPVYEKEGYLVKEYLITENNDAKIIIDVVWERNPELFKLEIYLETELYFEKYYAVNENVNIELPVREDYILISDFDVPTNMPSKDVVINLFWEKEYLSMYVMFDCDELGVIEYKYKSGDTVYEPNLIDFPELTKYGYDFGGYTVEFPFVITEDIDVDVVWIPKKTIINFDSFGADYLEFNQMEIEFNGYLILPNVSKEGYNFEGWYYYSERIKNGQWDRLYYQEIVLTAKWSYGLEYYEFGKYPQTHVSDKDLIDKLNALTTTNFKGYYELDGEEYCKIEAQPVVENELYYSDGVVAINGIEWFKVEPIKWIVEGENSYTLTPKYLLDVTVFDLNGDPYSASDYRYFLNNSFLNLAFTNDEIEMLIPMSNAILEHIVSGNSVTTILRDVKDKVFAKSVSYGGGKMELTDYALAKGASLTKSTNNTTNISKYYGNWWVYEQYQYDVLDYRNTYYYFYKGEFVSSYGNKQGICINMTIKIDLE